ncbi:bilirubin oxidase, partial [Streptomyces populi]
MPLAAARRAEAADTPAPANSTTAPAVEPFTVPMPLIPVARPVSTAGGVDTYESTTRKITKEILPGIRTELLTYDGLFPGATIRACRNRPVVLVQHNGLDVPISRHLHGASVPQDSDGGPMDTIAPGDTRVYRYPNKQPHASLWYHDHAHHTESENVYRGLHGGYLLGDATERALPLPRGRYDVLIALRDADFDASGQLLYAMGDRSRNTLLVNGAPYPYFEVAARKYRLRFANTSNMRFFELRLADGGDLVQIGSDGGLLPAPHTT